MIIDNRLVLEENEVDVWACDVEQKIKDYLTTNENFIEFNYTVTVKYHDDRKDIEAGHEITWKSLIIEVYNNSVIVPKKDDIEMHPEYTFLAFSTNENEGPQLVYVDGVYKFFLVFTLIGITKTVIDSSVDGDIRIILEDIITQEILGMEPLDVDDYCDCQ